MKLFCRRQAKESDFDFLPSTIKQIACTLIESTIEWININRNFPPDVTFFIAAAVLNRMVMAKHP